MTDKQPLTFEFLMSTGHRSIGWWPPPDPYIPLTYVTVQNERLAETSALSTLHVTTDFASILLFRVMQK
jgi:hypothetical protein